jgi:uncharacterized protein
MLLGTSKVYNFSFIKYGQMPWDEIDRWRLELHKEFNAALANTVLPERPNYEKANNFLIRSRKSMVKN